MAESKSRLALFGLKMGSQSPAKVAVGNNESDENSVEEPVGLTPEDKLRELEDWEQTLSGQACRFSLYFFQIALSPLLFPFVFGYVYAFNEDVNEDEDHHSAGVGVSLAQLSFIRRQKTLNRRQAPFKAPEQSFKAPKPL